MRRIVRVVLAAAVLSIAAPPTAALPPESDAWHVRKSEHFTVLGDGDEKSTLKTAEFFEIRRAAFGMLVPNVPLRTAPMDIYVFKTPAALVPYSLLKTGVDPTKPTGYYRSAEYVKLTAVMANQEAGSLEVAVGGYLSDVAQTTYPTAPPWVQSGLAQIYSGLIANGEEFDIGRLIRSHVILLRRDPGVPFQNLFAMTKPVPPPGLIGAPSVFDAESWALMHYLLIGSQEARPKTLAFLAALAENKPARQAFDAAYGPEFASTLDATLAAYVARESLPFVALPKNILRIQPCGDAAPMSRRDTLHRLGWLLVNIDEANAPQAEAHFRAALAIDPAHGASEAGLGWLRSRAKQYDEAIPFFDRALADGADDPVTLTMAGRNLLAQYGAKRATFEAPKEIPESVARARAMFRRAIVACPKCGEPRAALGATYLYDPGPSAPGIAELEIALSLAPARSDPLLNLVSLYARSGDRARGQAIIDGPINALGDAAVTASARERLAFADLAAINTKIAMGDLDGALTLLNSARDSAATPRLKAQFESEIARITPVAANNRHVAKFNDAVALANAGNWKAAGMACDELLAEPLDEALKPRVEDLRRRAVAATAKKK
jgi:tetratricopeptide (TPR) repeat protein